MLAGPRLCTLACVLRLHPVAVRLSSISACLSFQCKTHAQGSVLQALGPSPRLCAQGSVPKTLCSRLCAQGSRNKTVSVCVQAAELVVATPSSACHISLTHQAPLEAGQAPKNVWGAEYPYHSVNATQAASDAGENFRLLPMLHPVLMLAYTSPSSLLLVRCCQSVVPQMSQVLSAVAFQAGLHAGLEP